MLAFRTIGPELDKITNVNSVVKKSLDALGVIAPAVCLVHCLATPILLTALPFITKEHSAGHQEADPSFHWAIILICAIAILPAYKAHKKLQIPLLFLAGSAFILVPAYVHVEGEVAHLAMAIAGSACLVAANLLNRRYAGARPCCEHPHNV